MGGTVRAPPRNPHVCNALGCWGVSWGASAQESRGPLDLGPPGTEAGGPRRSQPSSRLGLVGWRDGCQPHATTLPHAPQFPQCGGDTPAVCPLQRVPSRAAVRAVSLALLQGGGGQQTPPAHPNLTPVPLALPLLPALASHPFFPTVSQSQESSPSPERGLFPLLPTFPGWEKSLEAPFRIPPGRAQGWERVGSARAQ